MKDYLIVYNIGKLVTVRGKNALRKGREMSDVEIIDNGYFIVQDGKFIEIGEDDGYLKYKGTRINANGLLILPGLIDSHTHLIHGGSRENEFLMKLEGLEYLDILAKGGGILNTVQLTRKAGFDILYNQAKKSLYTMMKYGVTTIEAKSGYGLDLDTEIKQLEVANKLNVNLPINIISTYMGAHAIPLEYKNNREEYINLVKKTLVEVKKRNLAIFCDVFCEKNVFTLDESEDILLYAASLGYKLKIHADEMSSLGGAGLAAKLNCTSADHLLSTNISDIKKLAQNNVVANILPLTSLYLNKNFADVRAMISNHCGVAIATDYNPGSSPSENLQLAMQIAAFKNRMIPKEIITAVTINAATSLGLENEKGSIDIGKDADFIICDCPNLDYLLYHFGINHVVDVYISGRKVVENQYIIGV